MLGSRLDTLSRTPILRPVSHRTATGDLSRVVWRCLTRFDESLEGFHDERLAAWKAVVHVVWGSQARSTGLLSTGCHWVSGWSVISDPRGDWKRQTQVCSPTQVGRVWASVESKRLWGFDCYYARDYALGRDQTRRLRCTVINSRDCQVEGLPLSHLEVRLEPQALVHAGRVESPRGGVLRYLKQRKMSC